MARRYYNGAVRNLNISIQSFPDVLVARAARLQGGAVLRARQPRRGGRAADRVSREASHERFAASPLALPAARRRRARRRSRSSASSRFVSDVTVERNGDLVVTETIRVRGGRPRHPPRHPARLPHQLPPPRRHATSRSASTSSRSRATASAETYAIEQLANGVRVRIGSADRLLPRGPHEYVIRYRTTRQIGFFPDYDELYWNVTGTGWTFPIERAEARITLPEAVPFRQTAFYTGPQGAQRQGRHRSSSSSPAASCSAPRARCRRSNGLTVAAAWQKGVVSRPPRRSRRLLARTTTCAGRRRLGFALLARLLRLRVDAGRPRSAGRHDHPAVRPAGRDVARGRALCRPDGVRQPRLHRRASSTSASTATSS